MLCGKVFVSHFCLFVWTWQGVWQINHLCLDAFRQTKSHRLLHCGKEMKFLAVIRSLLNVETRNEFTMETQVEVVRTLLSRGINPSLKDQHDR